MMGIISACAERTHNAGNLSIQGWDHLRVCGADGNGTGHIRLEQGSSPRVRSGRHDCQTDTVHHGIISACAERTFPDHPVRNVA